MKTIYSFLFIAFLWTGCKDESTAKDPCEAFNSQITDIVTDFDKLLENKDTVKASARLKDIGNICEAYNTAQLIDRYNNKCLEIKQKEEQITHRGQPEPPNPLPIRPFVPLPIQPPKNSKPTETGKYGDDEIISRPGAVKEAKNKNSKN